MPNAFVWDVPTRLFHWSIVLLFGLSWWSAEYDFDTVHFWSGYAFLFALLFRLMWGLGGSSTARFGNFVRGPAVVLKYLRGGRQRSAAGHSPLGALSVVALLTLLTLQIGLGLFAMNDGGWDMGPLSHFISVDAAEFALDLHELNFNIILGFVGLHIAAVLFYQLALKKDLIRPMISGRARLAAGTEPMRPAPLRRAVLCAIAALAITAWIVAGAPPFAP